MSQTHIAVGIVSEGKLGLFDTPTRSPGAGEVLFQVQYAAFSAADAHALYENFYVTQYPQIVGLGAVGSVVALGPDTNDLQVGDVVGAFCQPGSDRATQQYIIAPFNRVTKISPTVDPREVAAMVDNFVCAWWTITNSLGFDLPEAFGTEVVQESVASIPILIWGGGTGAGVYMLQLLRGAGFRNIITTASPRSAGDASSYGATHVFDYHDPDVVQKILDAAGSSPIKYAVDTVCVESSLNCLAQIVRESGGKVAALIPFKVGNFKTLQNGQGQLLRELPQEHNPFSNGIELISTATFAWESDVNLKPKLITKLLPMLLNGGHLRGQGTHVLDEGTLLERVERAAALVQLNKLGGKKAVIDFSSK